jgi:hypothetical protein
MAEMVSADKVGAGLAQATSNANTATTAAQDMTRCPINLPGMIMACLSFRCAGHATQTR